MSEASEEDDYLSMSFGTEDSSKSKETSLQRTTRLKKEAAERGRVLSKAELAAREKATRDAGLATEMDSSNKGAKMMSKMGFKGGALGKSEDARTQPIELLTKHDRGGIGMDSEKKRKIREAAEAGEEDQKRRKVDMDDFRERNRAEREEKRAEGLMLGAMKVLEGFEADATPNDDQPDTANGGDDRTKDTSLKHLRDVNVLYRPLLKQRLEKERERKMRYDLNNSLSTRNDAGDDEDEDHIFDTRIAELGDEDAELEEFEALEAAERLAKIVHELREKYRYCFWCKFQYPDEELEGCPGLTEDEHG